MEQTKTLLLTRGERIPKLLYEQHVLEKRLHIPSGYFKVSKKLSQMAGQMGPRHRRSTPVVLEEEKRVRGLHG